ncbi:MFS transporter [Sphingomonas jatrophae]|uniref:Predicted arabinose efflux permease, MFS family n=1 Tax=Sphingomonas jatrophae TaxID=1166337 RepID=A0A1I6KA84_9SPHN|nr:MFS transporter [Sphingomonas jatrophae]SFR88054.1 Predicted arabinose efflux permease, MFS family [Sphingomonas jatrophae]
MSDAARTLAPPESGPHFIHRFLLLSVVSGTSIALGRIATQLFAIHLGANPLQIGTIIGVEQAMMMTMAVPAGFLISHFGVRASYFTASLGPMLVYLAMPFISAWPLLVPARALIGLCIPFRIVSMNTSFLRELPRIGADKAGWYRGSQTIGLALIGPSLAALVTAQWGYGTAFIASGLMFGLMGASSLSFFPDTREAAGSAPAPLHREVRALLRDEAVFESIVIEHVSSATVALFSTFILVLAIRERGLTREAAVSLIAVQGATTVASLFLLNRLYMRLSRRAGYLWSLVAGVVAMLCFGLGRSYAPLAAGAVLLSLASASIHFQNMTQLSRSPANKSKVSGLFNLAGMSGNMVGSLGGGILSALASLHVVYLAWIASLFAAAGLILWRARRQDA